MNLDFDNLHPIFKDTPIPKRKQEIINHEFPDSVIIKFCQEYNVNECLNNLLIVARWLNFLNQGGYKKFNQIANVIDPFQKDFDKIFDLVATYENDLPKNKLTKIKIDYIDNEGNYQPITIENGLMLLNIRTALIEMFNKDQFNKAKKNYHNHIRKGPKKRYKKVSKKWVAILNEYLIDKISHQEKRYDFIGYFLEKSEMPLCYTSTKEGSHKEGDPIPDYEFPQTIKDYLKK